MFHLQRFNIKILIKLLMDKISVELLIALNSHNYRLLIHDLCRLDNAKLAHQMNPPSSRPILNIAILLSIRQSIVFWLILHIFEFVADVHLDEFMAAVQC